MANEPMPINEFLSLLARTGGLSDSQVFGINVIVEICDNLHIRKLAEIIYRLNEWEDNHEKILHD